MNKPSKFTLIYWRVFNLLSKVAGFAFLVGGFIVGSYFLPSLVGSSGAVNVNRVPSSDLVYLLLAVLLPYMVAVLGFFLIRARPYYPKGIADWLTTQDVLEVKDT